MDSYAASSVMEMVGDNQTMVEARISARIMVRSDLRDDVTIFGHYENSFSKGEYLSALDALQGHTGYNEQLVAEQHGDNDQLFSLTQEYVDENGESAYHRIDRLFLQYRLQDADVRFGRQAIYWGYGNIFQVADLVNPFSPTDIMRDYKEGRDMLSVRARGLLFSDDHLLLIPGRNPSSSQIEYDYSAILARMTSAGRRHMFSIYAGEQYGSELTGFGGRYDYMDGSVKGDVIVARGDAYYLSAVINTDYEWRVFDNKTLAYAELYYNSMGKNSLHDALATDDFYIKIDNGDISLRDRYYSAFGLTYHAAASIETYAQIILNIRDLSYIFQPKVEYEYRKGLTFTFGVDIPFGASETEFGGFYDEVSGKMISPAKRVYGQVSMTF